MLFRSLRAIGSGYSEATIGALAGCAEFGIHIGCQNSQTDPSNPTTPVPRDEPSQDCDHRGGPNGAGKTTFARAFLPQEAQCPHFINADLIAAGLSPFAPEAAAIRAGRLMLEEIAACAGRRESFAFETTLSGLGYLRHIRAWKATGYHVSLFYLGLPAVDDWALYDNAGDEPVLIEWGEAP